MKTDSMSVLKLKTPNVNQCLKKLKINSAQNDTLCVMMECIFHFIFRFEQCLDAKLGPEDGSVTCCKSLRSIHNFVKKL